jgi:hypothetical protein
VWFKLWDLKLQAKLKTSALEDCLGHIASRTNIGRFVSSVDLDSWVCPLCKGS